MQMEPLAAASIKLGGPEKSLNDSAQRGLVRLFVEASQIRTEQIIKALEQYGRYGRPWAQKFCQSVTGTANHELEDVSKAGPAANVGTYDRPRKTTSKMDEATRPQSRYPTKDPPLNVVALAGGGIRGYSTLLILQELGNRTFPELTGRVPTQGQITTPRKFLVMNGGTSTYGLTKANLCEHRSFFDITRIHKPKYFTKSEDVDSMSGISGTTFSHPAQNDFDEEPAASEPIPGWIRRMGLATPRIHDPG